MPDGGGGPRAIVRTTHVETRRVDEIDDAFAFAAGEGDLTLASWLTAHRHDFGQRAERGGLSFDAASVLVLEDVECVWPPRDR